MTYGDIIKATLDPINEHVFDFEIIEESGNSLVWMLDKLDLDVTVLKSQILALGCNFEGFEKFLLFAIEVPPSVDKIAINELVDSVH